MKGCPLRCRWCSNAESMNAKPELGIIIDRCNGCGYCIDVCPENALHLENEKVVINREKCNACGECVAICSPEAITVYGKEMSVDDVLKEVLKDREFYSGSNGGVTVSGGEPLRQPEFVKGLFSRCKKEGIHTCIETCGYVSTDTFKEILPMTDYILFDLKHMDTNVHKEFTGVDNEIIKDNARLVAKSGSSVLFRMPVIEGVNGTEENIRETAEFIKTLGGEKSVELLPYHRLGIGKYKTLGKKYPGEELNTPSDEVIEKIKTIFESYGIKCTIGG
jgi:pyruvate formate lyase activating enzyme